MSSGPEYRYLGPGLEAHLYYTDSETYSAFIANTDQTKDLATTFNGNTYSLSAWSMSILPDCKNVVFNTTKDTTDYLWYTTESRAVKDLLEEKGGEMGETAEHIIYLLKKMKGIQEIGSLEEDRYGVECLALETTSPTVPEDFRCPISLKLMKDPVIVATGQTYDQLFSQKMVPVAPVYAVTALMVVLKIKEQPFQNQRKDLHGLEDAISRLEPHSIFGEIAVLCKIPQPYTVRVCELCRLLPLEKQSFVNILQLYFKDGRQVLTNLLEGKEIDLRIKQLESDIILLIAKQEAELTLQVNSAAYHGDLYHLKILIRAGEDPARADYDGRTALHLAASKGYEEITLFLIPTEAECGLVMGIFERNLPVFVPKYDLQGVVQLQNKNGNVILPLDKDETDSDTCNDKVNSNGGKKFRLQYQPCRYNSKHLRKRVKCFPDTHIKVY
ncbi:hypothetical protein SUGI_0885860 [Cryptomeria japonica]|nr:hypothetical protein SUGI_0885860 [Cryptomeria japonica]